MVRIFKVNDLVGRKRALVLQSDMYRQTLKLQISTARITASELKSKLITLDLSSFALKTAADIAGMFIANAKADEGRGFFSKVMSGFKLFNEIRDFFRHMKRPQTESPRDEPAAANGETVSR